MPTIRGFERKQKQSICKIKDLKIHDTLLNENDLYTLILKDVVDPKYIKNIKHPSKEEILQTFINKALEISLQTKFINLYQIAVDIKTPNIWDSKIIIGKEHIGFNAMLSIDNEIARQINSSDEQTKWSLIIPTNWKNKRQWIGDNKNWYIGVWI